MQENDVVQVEQRHVEAGLNGHVLTVGPVLFACNQPSRGDAWGSVVSSLLAKRQGRLNGTRLLVGVAGDSKQELVHDREVVFDERIHTDHVRL